MITVADYELMKKIIDVRNTLREEARKTELVAAVHAYAHAVRLIEQTFDIRPEKFGGKW
jgi:hypothetical protein